MKAGLARIGFDDAIVESPLQRGSAIGDLIFNELGNQYGISYEAQRCANSILKRVSKERWTYFLNDCLKVDDRILYKLRQENPRARWMELVSEFSLGTLASREITDRSVRQLIVESDAKRAKLVDNIVVKLIERLGYEAS